MTNTPTPPPSASLLIGVDWPFLAVAVGMAAAMSLGMTLRARKVQREAKLPLSPWDAVLGDILVGAFVGFIAATLLPLVVTILLPNTSKFDGFPVRVALAGIGGMIGPQLADRLMEYGPDALWNWLEQRSGGIISRKKREGDHDRDTSTRDTSDP